MDTIQVDETLKEHSFAYGQHTITVRVNICSYRGKRGSNIDYGVVRNDRYYSGYFREVEVVASEGATNTDEENADFNIKNTTKMKVGEVTIAPGITTRMRVLFSKVIPRVESNTIRQQLKRDHNRQQVSLEEQLEQTARPVLEKIDEYYQVSGRNIDIDIEVALDKFEAETSWVEVEDEISQISKELDIITE